MALEEKNTLTTKILKTVIVTSLTKDKGALFKNQTEGQQVKGLAAKLDGSSHMVEAQN